MFEPYMRQATLRLPMVMALATREMTSPETVWSGQQDAMSVREAGWMQVFCESNQEIIDMIIQGYMLAEDPRVLLPINVCYDGFYSSHLTEGAELPDQEDVDAFLPHYSADWNPILNPDKPLALDPLTAGPLLMKYRKSHLDAMERALAVLEEVDAKFAAAVRKMKEAGYRKVCSRIYPEMRHEILNENGKEEVWKDILDFCDEICTGTYCRSKTVE